MRARYATGEEKLKAQSSKLEEKPNCQVPMAWHLARTVSGGLLTLEVWNFS
jgi:hypothetical protein